MFWLFHSLHECALPHSETGIRRSDDALWHGSKWCHYLIEFQLYSLCGIKVLACSFDKTSTMAYFDNNLCNKEDGKGNDPLIC